AARTAEPASTANATRWSPKCSTRNASRPPQRRGLTRPNITAPKRGSLPPSRRCPVWPSRRTTLDLAAQRPQPEHPERAGEPVARVVPPELHRAEPDDRGIAERQRSRARRQ